MKKMEHIFNRKKNGALNRGTLIHFVMKNTLKCNKNNTFFHNFQRFAIFEI